MQTEAFHLVNVSTFSKKAGGLRNANVGGKFDFRQGLWIEDLRIPPGQECSNGSLILLAVVLWRTSLLGDANLRSTVACGTHPQRETFKDKNDTLFADSGEMRPAEYSYSLAKTRRRPAFSNAIKEQSVDDSPKERERDRFWNHWLQRK